LQPSKRQPSYQRCSLATAVESLPLISGSKTVGYRRPLAPEDERAELGGRDDVDPAILVQISSIGVRADAGTVVNEFRHELRAAGRFRVRTVRYQTSTGSP
jgi:hypothetical protein